MNEDDKEYISDALHECIDVVSECEHHHEDEECHREILHRFLELLGHLRQILRTEHSENERNTEQNHDGLEDLPERNLKLRKQHALLCKVQIHPAPEREVQRGGEDAGCCVEGSQRN